MPNSVEACKKRTHRWLWQLPSSPRGRSFRDDTGQLCQPTGVFRNPPFAGSFLWLPGPDKVVIVYGALNTAGVQRVYLDRPHPRNLLPTWNGHSIGRLLGYTEHDRVVIPVPFYHCFGMVIGNLNALSFGAATIIPSRGFNPSAALEAVQDFGGTSLYGVPTMFIAELALPDFATFDLSTLRTGVMAGSLCVPGR